MAPWGDKRVRRVLPALVLACSLGLGMQSAMASTAPAPPVLTGTNPPSPGNRVHVFVQGTAPAGTTVSVYPTGDCSGPPYPSGSAATLASPGIEVEVPNDETTTLSATATDASSNVSACSAPISYAEDSRPPGTFIGRLHFNRAKGTVTPVFSSDEPQATFECHWSRWGRCLPGRRTWHLRPRPRRRYFQVRATDAAGNVDTTPAIKAVTYNPVV
jgi:hypothetical protein